MAESIQEIGQELELLKKEVSEIKRKMIDFDSIMDEEDYEALREYKEEKKKGILVSHEEMKRELGI